ncbi:hypothetical protein TRFO_01237 [Tritrichomonas foetus]|uniref:RING-type domain-containing protein n=1 Tax=Tritrichomonas foetus TaxID=1144522 RepID=A0A1J4K6Y8_9EUKA|nr:hypothetical protein TRFO_01237 [Tritrichomonas foetus]|eukprot:OHT07135.1 hypothetical protein TRFO_01237 [Tritrichomonas foetus]
MSNVDDIIQRQKLKQQLWLLQSKQEQGESDEPTPLETPDEYRCPICYEDYDSEKRKPIVLFPCGHSVCFSCLTMSERSNASKKCCLCNTHYTKTATNFALQSAMSLQNNSSNTNSKPTFDFKNDLKIALARFDILSSQLRENEAKSKRVKNDLKSAQIFYERLQDELTFVQQQLDIQGKKVNELSNEDSKIDKDIKNIQDILGPLTTEIQKLKLLAQSENQS